jgi:hypothetical protein
MREPPTMFEASEMRLEGDLSLPQLWVRFIEDNVDPAKGRKIMGLADECRNSGSSPLVPNETEVLRNAVLIL